MNSKRFWRKLGEYTDSLPQVDLSALFQHKAYHRHFEGYVEEKVTNARGKTKVRRVYKGEYYTQNLPRLQYVLLRVVYCAGMLLGGFLFLKGSIFDLDSNYAAGVVLVQSVTGLLIVWFGVTLLVYLFTPRRMTVGDYHTVSASFQKALRNIVVGLVAVIAVTILYDLFFERQLGVGDLLCVLYFAASCLIFAGMKWLEGRVEYQTIS